MQVSEHGADVNSRARPLVRAVELVTVSPNLAVLLDPAELARAAAIQTAGSRENFIAGRVAQRLMVAEFLGAAPAKLTANYWCPDCGPDPMPSHGRPGYRLGGQPAEVSISFTRSHGWGLAAMVPSQSVALGIDLQAVAAIVFDGFDDVALSEAEKSRLARISPDTQNAWRAAVWARKEALAKYSALGLRTDPKDLSAFPEPDALVAVEELVPATLGLPAGFAAAIAFSANANSGKDFRTNRFSAATRTG